MAKKRKATSAPAARDNAADNSSKRTRMRINTYEDVAGSDDEFHINRDKVMLDDGPEAKRRRKAQEDEEFLEQSDEEVLGYSSPSEVDEDDDGDDMDADDLDQAQPKKSKGAQDEDEVDDDEVAGWGSTKQDYYDADVIETEQDALDEEKEALRLQKKQLQAMSAADYGFDEADWQQEEKEDDEQDGEVVTEVLPQLDLSDDMGPAERLKLLKSRYPEFEPLSKELLSLQTIYKDLSQQQSPTTATKTKQQAAAAYLASLTMYFALLTSTADDSQTNGLALSATTIRDHPVMDSLIQCRDLWSQLKDLPEDEPEEASALDVSEDALSEDEPTPVLDVAPTKARKTKKTKAQRAAEAAEAEAAARRAERLRQTEADFADLDALTAGVSQPRSKKASTRASGAGDQSDSDFGEDAELTAHEMAEKAKRKKSLRFYTSQIAQKANKRGAAGRNAGGDDDIPHRERLRDRQARLNAEAAARGRNEPRDELGGDSEDEDDRRMARDVRGDEGSEDDYYDMVAAKSAKKKSDKAALAAAHKEAAAQGGRVVEQEEVGADGKRAISYAIEKNKGLTPHRKKDVRNPRVKKRKKYEDKKKKLSSIKPVYKGGEGRGGYGGELTGIKKGIVRSTKL